MNSSNISKGEIILYQTSDKSTVIDVRIENETIWLSQKQISELFSCSVDNAALHLKNIYKEQELSKNATSEQFSVVQIEGSRSVTRKNIFYNLDAIISVGYRVNSKRGTQFRIWANKVLKDYLLKGYAINQRVERLESKVLEHDQKFDLIIETFTRSHDRFMIIDSKTIYHIGASLKDLGKKWFAFSRININAKEILEKIES